MMQLQSISRISRRDDARRDGTIVRSGLRSWALALALLLVAGAAHAAGDGFGTVSASDAQGNRFELVALSSDVQYEVSGIVAEARIHQRFTSHGAGPINAQYLLPLPEGAAVHDLTLHVGNRTIIGEIHEKEAARAIYVEAAASGRRASLVEADRAQLFRTAVANIGPGETLDVEVRWWQQVAFHDGRFELTLPLTYTPRFVPTASATDAADIDAGHLNSHDRHSVDAPRVSVHVAIDSGVALARVESPSHVLKISGSGARRSVDFADGAVPADRDFVLQWTPVIGSAPVSSVLVEQWQSQTYALAMLLPPAQLVDPLPRELVLVIDTSGSMEGGSINQAKAALDLALQSLRPGDRFNVIQFNSVVEALHENAVVATPDALRSAREWVARLHATGGTEMGAALQAALVGHASPGYVRQVVFVTDGAVDDAPGLYAGIESALGESRLFTVGIGSAPNAHFIERAARLGRGTAIVIRKLDEVGERMRELFGKLDSPALRDVAISWPGSGESYPARLPDLYAGEPLIAVVRLSRASGSITATATSRDASWSATLRFDQATSASGIARLWAQRKVEDLQHELDSRNAPDDTRAQIVQLALDHHLVTPYTSLVAVDRTPVAATDVDAASVRIANGLPDGSLQFAQTATPATLEALLGLLLCALAAAFGFAPRAFRGARA